MSEDFTYKPFSLAELKRLRDAVEQLRERTLQDVPTNEIYALALATIPWDEQALANIEPNVFEVVFDEPRDGHAGRGRMRATTSLAPTAPMSS